MSLRIKRLVKPTTVVLAIGFTYILLHELTGFSLHCPIYRVFGVYCPGCGVGRMCFHLLHLEFAEAFSANCVVFCLLPIALIALIFHGYHYLRYGDGSFYKAERVGLWAIVGILLLFAVVRNLKILIP